MHSAFFLSPPEKYFTKTQKSLVAFNKKHFHRPSYAICESQIPKYIVIANSPCVLRQILLLGSSISSDQSYHLSEPAMQFIKC